MQATISIAYHTRYGHTEQIANILAENMQTKHSAVHLVNVAEAKENLHFLNSSDTIVFGCPTCFGNVSAGFKEFVEYTGEFWYQQTWKDKLAAGFTVSPTNTGDKLNTLVSLALFAAQHSMIWISQGIMPRFCNNMQTEGQNRLASYLGLMVQSDSAKQAGLMHPGDLLTTELFAKRILDLTLKFKHIKINNYDTVTN